MRLISIITTRRASSSLGMIITKKYFSYPLFTHCMCMCMYVRACIYAHTQILLLPPPNSHHLGKL